MKNEKIASELMKLAKELVASDKTASRNRQANWVTLLCRVSSPADAKKFGKALTKLVPDAGEPILYAGTTISDSRYSVSDVMSSLKSQGFNVTDVRD